MKARPIEPCYVKFGAWMKERRKQTGLTQAEVAEAIGFSRGSVANIEAGNQRILLHTAEDIRTALARLGEDKLLATAAEILERRARDIAPPPSGGHPTNA